MKAQILAVLVTLAALLFGSAAIAQENYRIGPGDRITVEVLEDPSLNRTVVVLPDGRFSFPFAGTVPAAGRTVSQVQAAITSSIAGNFAAEPTVFVSVVPGPDDSLAPGELELGPTIRVYYLGEVAAPGVREVPDGTTFLQALSQAGGYTNFAALKRVQLRRTDPTTGQQELFQINYKAIADGAQLTNDFGLADGDVILIPQRRLFE